MSFVEMVPLSLEAVDTYLGAVDWLCGVLGQPEVAAAWTEPSAVEGYTVGGVATHAVQSVFWLERLLKEAEPVGLRLVTVLEYYGPNRAGGSDDADPVSASLRVAAAALALKGAEMVVASCITARDELAGLLTSLSATRAVPVIRVPGGQAPLGQYLRTRVLELVVHGDDVLCSVPGLRVADPPAPTVETCLEVCLELARSCRGSPGPSGLHATGASRR